jgi:hypothetical protein
LQSIPGIKRNPFSEDGAVMVISLEASLKGNFILPLSR